MNTQIYAKSLNNFWFTPDVYEKLPKAKAKSKVFPSIYKTTAPNYVSMYLHLGN